MEIKCPSCGFITPVTIPDGPMYDKLRPADGDFTFCMDCQSVLCFTGNDFEVRTPTAEDMEGFTEAHQTIVDSLKQAREEIGPPASSKRSIH